MELHLIVKPHRRSDLERQLVCVAAPSGNAGREQRLALGVDRTNAAAINCVRARRCSCEVAVDLVVGDQLGDTLDGRDVGRGVHRRGLVAVSGANLTQRPALQR